MADTRIALVKAARRLHEIGGFPATDGNLSARGGPCLFWISRSGVEKGTIAEDAFVLIDVSGGKVDGYIKPSSEWPMHLAIYHKREDICAILHAHTPYLTAFAAARKIPDTAILAEAELAIGGICLVPYAPPGSAFLGKEMVISCATPGVYLLENHGAVAVGKTVVEALHRMERAEFLARVMLLSEKIGGGIPLSEAQIHQLRQQGR